MDWNEIWNWINTNYAQLGVTGLLVLETGKSVFKTLGFNKMLSMTVSPITKSNNVVFDKVSNLVSNVNTLTLKVQELTTVGIAKDKQIETLSNLVVTTLAVANVPTSAKETFFNSVVKAKVVGDDATLFLGKMIEERKRQEAVVQVVNDSAIQALNESEV